MKFTYMCISFMRAKMSAPVGFGERLRGSNHPGHVAVMHMPRHHFVNLRFNCLRCNYRDMNGLHYAHRCCRTIVQLGKSVVCLIFLWPRLAAENHLCAPAGASRHVSLSEKLTTFAFYMV